jgi:predicted regulator of Ras-like GTPase activity (Roadblock/LC7/MglB family)
MKQPIPEGTSIGEIETSLEWLLSHTARFRGVILVRINTGEGFILIEYGRPVGFTFRMGDRALQGEAARRYFERKDLIHASLRRYTEREFLEALDRAGPEVLVPAARECVQRLAKSSVPAPVTPHNHLDFEEVRQKGVSSLPERISDPAVVDPHYLERRTAAGINSGGESAALTQQVPPEENFPVTVLDWICLSPGVTAAAIFRDRSIVDYRGELSFEDLVESAEDLLLTAGEILTLLSTGPLVQVTILVSGKNVTISSFEDSYLLILTEPDANLGQIRKLVHDCACGF